jgi:hypothetical protein
MRVGSYTLKGMLITAWKGCLASDPVGSLRETLTGKVVEVMGALGGGAVKSTSANGQHTTFVVEGLTLQVTGEAWTYLVDEYDRAASELGVDPPVDLDVYNRMYSNLRPVHPGKTNWMYLMK